jgi:RNA 2',3'-cyclic 3'-phosphodiesterase
VIRAFVAIQIDPKTVENISAAVARLKTQMPGVRWVAQENIHLTLKFLGEVDEARVDPIARSLEDAIRPFPRFIINAKGLGVFPDLKRPRIVWVGLISRRLSALASAVERAFESLGFEPEKRDFAPHLTIGRWRDSKGSKRSLVEAIENWKDYEFGQSVVEKAILFQSVLKPEGAVYQVLRAVALAHTSLPNY